MQHKPQPATSSMPAARPPGQDGAPLPTPGRDAVLFLSPAAPETGLPCELSGPCGAAPLERLARRLRRDGIGRLRVVQLSEDEGPLYRHRLVRALLDRIGQRAATEGITLTRESAATLEDWLVAQPPDSDWSVERPSTAECAPLPGALPHALELALARAHASKHRAWHGGRATAPRDSDACVRTGARPDRRCGRGGPARPAAPPAIASRMKEYVMFNRIGLTAAAVFALFPFAQSHAGGYHAPVIEAEVAAPAARPVPKSVATGWTGPYAGIAFVDVFGADDRLGIANAAGHRFASPGQLDIRGGGGALQAGFRWQSSVFGRDLVIGPELSYEGSSADADLSWAGGRGRSALNHLWALRLKAGVLSETRTTLFYGSLGAARGTFDYSVQGDGMRFAGRYHDTAWTLGLGLEQRLGAHVSVFGEWELRQFGKSALTDAAGFTTRATPAHQTVRVGLNVSF